MWHAEFEFDGSSAPAGSIAKQLNISFFAYPISITIEKDKLLIYFSCNIYGDDKNIKKLLKILTTHERVHFHEIHDTFMIILIEEPLSLKSIYQHSIIHTKPIFISSQGREIWSIASSNRENLIEFSKILYEIRNSKMKFLKQKELTSISITQITPKLTSKQNEAMKLAIENGYYSTPRKIDLKTLAQKFNSSFSTFQVHLRKAENKLIPYSFLKINKDDIYR